MTLADVFGARIDDQKVKSLVEDATIVIAHHAAFDRKFLEPRFPVFEHLPFGCSMTQAPWEQEGHDGAKLAYLMMRYGFFHNTHDAAADCSAVLTLLSQSLPVSGGTALSYVIDAAATPTCRVWAVRTRIDSKEILKRRGYRWSPGYEGKPRAWYIDVHPADLQTEREFLSAQIYCGNQQEPIVTDIDARRRFSSRE